jgi:hydrogenase large subunit
MIEGAKPGRPVQIHDTQHWDPPTSPGDRYGVGMTEAPRGSLAHWVQIVDNGGPTKEIGRYACVVPTTWNSSPEGVGGRGPYEEALMGCPVPDEANPINVVRIIRSFDPCIACAVHVITPKGDTKKFAVDF